MGAGALSHGGAVGRRKGQTFSQGTGQRFGVSGRHQPAGRPIRGTGVPKDRFGWGAKVGCDDRAGHDLGFRRRAAERFGFGGGDDRDMSQGEGGGHVPNMPDEAHAVFQSAGADQAFELSAIAVPALGVTRHHDNTVAKFAPGVEQSGGFDHHPLTLPAGEARGLQNDTRVRRNPP